MWSPIYLCDAVAIGRKKERKSEWERNKEQRERVECGGWVHTALRDIRIRTRLCALIPSTALILIFVFRLPFSPSFSHPFSPYSSVLYIYIYIFRSQPPPPTYYIFSPPTKQPFPTPSSLDRESRAASGSTFILSTRIHDHCPHFIFYFIFQPEIVSFEGEFESGADWEFYRRI